MIAIRENLGLVRQVGAARHRWVVRNDHYLSRGHTPDPDDHSGARRLVVVHSIRSQSADLEKWRARIQEPTDAIARQQLASLNVSLAMLRRAAAARCGDRRAQHRSQRPVVRVTGAKGLARSVD